MSARSIKKKLIPSDDTYIGHHIAFEPMFSLICKFFIQFSFSRYAGPHFTKVPLLKTPTKLELNGSLDLSRPESINQQIPNMSCKSSTIKPKNNLKVKPKAPMSKEEIKAQQLLKAMGKHRKRIYVISGSEALFAS